MKALTIKEPWATLIIDGYKEYEFRSWKTNYRGKILIHAGKSLERGRAKKFKGYNLEYSCGEIIGEAELVDCIKVTEEFDEYLKEINAIFDRFSKDGFISIPNETVAYIGEV